MAGELDEKLLLLCRRRQHQVMLECRDVEASWARVVLPGQVASGLWLVVVVVMV